MPLFFLFIIGLSIGSFLNVLIDRLPKRQSIRGRSYCDNCKKQIKNIDLIPIFSFFALKGKCRFCHKKISLQYPLIELLTGIIFVSSFLLMKDSEIIIRILNLAIISAFIVIFFSDLKYQIIPDEVILFTFVISIFLLIFKNITLEQIAFQLLEGTIIAFPIFLIYFISKGKSMGFGDVKLTFVIGFLLGLQKGIISLYIAFIIGAVIGIFLMIFKNKTMKSKVALGPFLVFGAFIVFLIDKVSDFVIVFFQ